VLDSYKPELMTLLHNLGVRTIEDRTNDGLVGFPVSISLPEGQAITLDLTTPGLLTAFDPSQFGVAVLDEHGIIRKTWGLANRLTIFRTSQSMLDSSLGALLEACLQGSHGAIYLDGYRYFSAGYSGANEMEAVVLVLNAHEEQSAKRQASKSWRVANALRRVGKVFTMNQQVQSITVAAAHEIASATELAAVLLWTVDPTENCLKLAASVGANRAGTNVLSKLALEGGSSCVAELVATTRAAFMAQDVGEHLMTCELEAKFCYLRPGGVSVHPLVISDRLLGVLELIGREEDPHFEEDQALFQTIAEHFALALNAAIMFEDFEKLATHDALTGIANHRYLQEFLHQRVLEAARTGQELGVIMLDVDHFRSFNEEEGHDAGDEVLRLVADAVKVCVRPYDLAARYGGEEFTVIMPGSSEQTTLAVAERIRQRVESISYMTRSGRDRHITASLGVASYPNGGVDAKDILKAADIALFEAKRSGRNRLVSFNGQAPFDGRKDDLNLAAILAWIPEEDRPASDELYARCLHDVATLSVELNLTVMQTAVLQALIRINPTLARIKDSDSEQLERMKTAEEFRLLLPSLEACDERYIDRGNKIPLLARILQVLLAVVDGQGKPLADDPDRFDAEIVSLVLSRRRAA
jgi:diguanylate cyclase (GGDEF)-like protein